MKNKKIEWFRVIAPSGVYVPGILKGRIFLYGEEVQAVVAKVQNLIRARKIKKIEKR